jgi:hypothetical protein
MNCAIATMEVPLVQQSLHQEQAIPEDNEKVVEQWKKLREFLFQKNISEKDCKELVFERGVNPDVRIYSMTLLEEAILCRFENAVDVLINKLGANAEATAYSPLDHSKNYECSLLHLATYGPEEMKMILNLYKRVSKKDQEFYASSRGMLPEIHASPKIVDLLLGKELSPLAKDKRGITPYKQVERFLANIKAKEDKSNSRRHTSYDLKKHPNGSKIAPRQYDYLGFKDEYAAIMDKFDRRFPNPPPSRYIPPPTGGPVQIVNSKPRNNKNNTMFSYFFR